LKIGLDLLVGVMETNSIFQSFNWILGLFNCFDKRLIDVWFFVGSMILTDGLRVQICKSVIFRNGGIKSVWHSWSLGSANQTALTIIKGDISG
jgi:hypothetical protein